MTGAHGFVGRHLQSELEGRGIETLAATADVRDGDAVARELQRARPDAIAHLAAVTSVADAWNRERDVWEVNALGTLNVVLAVAEHAPEARLLVVSSSEVYGQITEDEGPVARGSPDRAQLAVRPLEGGGRGCLCPWRHRLCHRTVLSAHRARTDRDVRDPLVRRADCSRRGGVGAADDQGRQPRRAPRLLRRALRGRCLHPPARAARRAACLNVATGAAHSMRFVLDRMLALTRVEIAVERDPSAPSSRGHRAPRRVPAPTRRGHRLEAKPVARRNTRGCIGCRTRRSAYRRE